MPQQPKKFILYDRDPGSITAVYHRNNSMRSSVICCPWCPQSFLSTKIPDLKWMISGVSNASTCTVVKLRNIQYQMLLKTFMWISMQTRPILSPGSKQRTQKGLKCLPTPKSKEIEINSTNIWHPPCFLTKKMIKYFLCRWAQPRELIDAIVLSKKHLLPRQSKEYINVIIPCSYRSLTYNIEC